MEIQALKLLITEQDLNDLVRKHIPQEPLENVKVRVAPEGVFVTGEYPLFVTVSFETLWELDTQAGKVSARIAKLKAAGIPGTPFKNMVIEAIRHFAQKEVWLTFDGDTILVDVDLLLAGERIQVKTNLTAVRCLAGALIIEAGT